MYYVLRTEYISDNLPPEDHLASKRLSALGHAKMAIEYCLEVHLGPRKHAYTLDSELSIGLHDLQSASSMMAICGHVC